LGTLGDLAGSCRIRGSLRGGEKRKTPHKCHFLRARDDFVPVCGFLNGLSVEEDQKASPVGHSSAIRILNVFNGVARRCRMSQDQACPKEPWGAICLSPVYVWGGRPTVWRHRELRAILVMFVSDRHLRSELSIFISTMAVSVFNSDARGFRLLSSIMAIGTIFWGVIGCGPGKANVRAFAGGSGCFRSRMYSRRIRPWILVVRSRSPSSLARPPLH
jgi:hypothetical protein